MSEQKLSADLQDDVLRIASSRADGGYGFATDIQALAQAIAELAGIGHEPWPWERHPETGEWRPARLVAIEDGP